MDLNPRFTFGTFVIGPSNRLAATAARAVAVSPGMTYNPLFIYGASGLGKTHLLHAVGFHARENQEGLQVRYVTLEEFVEQTHAAAAAGQAEAYRRSLDETDLLLLDDVQFLARHRELQSELIRLAEELQQAGRQLVMVSDRPPAEIGALDERLVTQLSGGLLVDVAAPDYETRLAILRRKADERGVDFGAGVLEELARAGASNVRDIVGLVNRLVAFQAVGNVEVTVEQARALAAGDAGDAARQLREAQPDEFSAFLSAVTRSVTQSLDAWRPRLGEAVLHWQGQGFRTARLEALLKSETPPPVEKELERFARECEELGALARHAEELDPAAAGHARFRDPDQLEEARAFVKRLRDGIVPPPAPMATLTFEDYVIGKANATAIRAARAVVDAPGRRYNPLYVTGPSGVGKTHLLHAIGNALAGRELVVACLSAPAFVEDLLAALDAGNVDWWRRRYRNADALLLDDVQLLAGKEQTQDELFNLYDILAAAGKQVVVTADRSPGELDGVAARLVTRFQGGLVVELPAPDREMRETMVRRLLESHGLKSEDGVLSYLAACPADSARAVQGLVNRAVSSMEPHETSLTAETARIAIEGPMARPSQTRAISSPVPSGLDPALAGREKLVWEWPVIEDRLIEEYR